MNIGRLSTEKGHIRMLEIFAKLPKNFYLNIAGEGSERNAIEKKIAELNLVDRVNLLGFQQEEALAKTISSSDIYLQTSYVEGFPNSLAQAAYAGLKVIAYDVPGGTKEIISQKNGVLVKDGAEAEMVKSIMNIMSKKITYNEVKQELDSKFNISLIIEDLKKSYMSRIEQNNIPVIYYHSVGNHTVEKPWSFLSVKKEIFLSQMIYLKKIITIHVIGMS